MMEMRDGIQILTWMWMMNGILFCHRNYFLLLVFTSLYTDLVCYSKPLPSRVKKEIVETEVKDQVCSPQSVLSGTNNSVLDI